MKVNIGPIRELPGGVLDFQGEQELLDYKLPITFTNPIQVEGTITNTGEGFLMKANCNFRYRVHCDRCLKEFQREQQTEIIVEFLATPGSDGEDDLAFHFSGDIIDLKDCISEQVLFALPMNFICKPDCLGLCPICGKDRNADPCDCVTEQFNPQFEQLRNLLSIKGGGPNGKS
ncbi:MAG TPA: hypothetical protein DDW50_00170 [Firmicutes bacterium]|nr:hypothetical protein [Bacillota bacterium]